MSENIFKHTFEITEKDRCKLNKHSSFVVWFTGLSCSGKSTLANELEKMLFEKGNHTYILDGDNIRKGLNSDLHFSIEDRKENLRRIGYVANLFVDAGIICIAAFIAPLADDRELLKNIIGREKFIEIFVDTPIEICEQRDVKGLYKKARKGEIKDFTGVNAPYERPTHPDLIIDTSKETIENSINKIMNVISERINFSNNR